MATVITTSTASTATTYSSQRKVDRTQTNGVLWAHYWDGNSDTTAAMHFRYSTDGGATWTDGGGFGFAGTGTTYVPNASILIDLDDYAHVVYKDRHDGFVKYRRGTPDAARTAYTWSAPTDVWAATTGDYPDLVVHREGTGWRAHVVFSRHDVNTEDSVYYARVDIDSAGAVTIGSAAAKISPASYGNTFAKFPSIDFNHTGDSKTVAGDTPHLYVGWSAGAAGAGKGIRFRKAVYASGAWTWNAEVEIDSTRYVLGPDYWVNCMFDGTRVALPGQVYDGTNIDVVLYERDAADTATTTRILTEDAIAAERLYRGSASYDSDGSVYLFGIEDDATWSLGYRKWDRASATLGARQTIDADIGDTGWTSVKRGYSSSRIEFIYTDGAASPYTVAYDAVSVNAAPNAPILTAPPDASTIDRNITQRFDWDFSDDDAGDSQSAYNVRYRLVGAATWTETGWQASPNTYHDYAAGTFAVGDYEWQAATKDAAGAAGPFSASWFFNARNAPSIPSITAPVNNATVSARETVTWSAPDQDSYQLRRVADNAGAADTATVYEDTGEVVSTARSRAVEFAVNNRYEHVQIRVKFDGLWSAWASIRVHVSYTPPATPTLTLTADDAAGALSIAIDSGAWPVTVTAPVFTGTGTGTMTGPTATAGVTDSHDWEAVCVTAAANGGTFDVKKDTVVVGQATVGTQFAHEGLALTINDGATDYAVGDKFTWTTTATKTASHEIYIDDGDGEERRAKNLALNVTHVYRTPVSGRNYGLGSRVRVTAIAGNGTKSST